MSRQLPVVRGPWLPPARCRLPTADWLRGGGRWPSTPLQLPLHPIDPHRLRDVLDPPLPEMLIYQGQLALDLVIDCPGDAQPPGLRQPFEAGGDIDALAVELVALHHHIAYVDANAKCHLPFGPEVSILDCEGLLDL